MVSRKSNPNRGSKPGERRGGRAPGTPNKVTQEFRETVRLLLDDNRDNVAIWLAQVAEKDPDKALDKLVRLAEFAAPKLSRAELAGDPAAPLQAVTRIELVPVGADRKD